MTSLSSPAEAAPAAAETPPTGVRALARPGRSGWGALALICAFAAVLGAALGTGAAGSSVVPALLAAVTLVSLGRSLLRWLRGGQARTRIRRRAAVRVEEFGGGAYGTVALATWLWLELGALRADWLAAHGLTDFLQQRSLQWFFGFGVESLLNALRACIWPLYWLRDFGLPATLLVAALAWALHALAGRRPALRRAPADPGLAG